jgi:VWFA-related protein
MRVAVATVAAFVLAAVLAAQVPADQQRPTFRAGVNFVSVDVYPTIDGRPVTDLKKDDFEVLEDGVVQRVETFEHIVARTAGAEIERAEPRSAEEGDQAAADPRNRLFVLFLDSYHTSVDSTTTSFAAGTNRPRATGSQDSRIGRALAKFLQQTIGPDDLIAVTRPELPVDSLTFTRRPSSFEDLLLSGGDWQRRFVEPELDETEREYISCYPEEQNRALVAAMIARRRERLVLDALHNLVFHLQNLREGRKALLVVSEGWVLYRPDRTLMVTSDGRAMGPPPIGVAGGQPTLNDPRYAPLAACDRDRMMLADLDDERDFRRMLDDANRANVTFYPIDPRGLAVFDGLPGGSVIADAASLRTRLDSLQTLASATDGIASVNSNDFARSFRRITDDLSSYYLLGYNSTNTTPDGKFHKITVRVKRPGVDVRARRGYNALTEADVASRAKAEAPVDPETRSRDTALASLGVIDTIRADRPLRLMAGYRWQTGTAGAALSAHAVLWVVGELDVSTARLPEWSGGGEASVTVSGNGQTVTSEKATITPTARTFLLQISAPSLTGGHDYLVKALLQGKPGPMADANEQLRVVLPKAPDASTLGQPIFYRRGPYTGAGFQPTADLRFRKAERLRLAVPLASAVDSASARLLDRKGQTLPIPVTAGQREDGGVQYATAEITLAPLAPGDFIVELSVRRGDKTERALAAFRMVP